MTIAPDRRLLAAAGALVLGSVLVVIAPAITLAWSTAVALIVTAALWDAWQLLRRPALVVDRTLPDRTAIDTDAEVILTLRTDAATSVRVTVIDECPSDLTPVEPTFDDVVLPPHSSHALRYPIRPTRRGDRPFGPIITIEAGTLGLLRRRTIHATHDELAVFPRGTVAAARHTLHFARRIADLGLRPDRRRGSGLEFESLRDYVPGDDPRHLDWAASLRRGRLVSRLHQQEREQIVMIGVDTSRLMGTRVGSATKLDHAIDAALALAVAGLVGGDRVGAFAFDRRVHTWSAPRAHRGQFGPILEALGRIEATDAEASYGAVARTVRLRQSRRALVVLFTDIVEAADDVLLEPLHALGRHHRVLLVAVRDPVFDGLDPHTPAGARLGPYDRLAIDFLRRGRDAALGRARQAGVQTLDLAPASLTAPVLNRYLALRAAPL